MIRYVPKPEDFAPLATGSLTGDAITRPPIGYWKDVWTRFRKNRLAIIGFTVLAILTVAAIVGPMISKWDYREIDFGHANELPSARHWLGTDYMGRDMFTRLWMGTRISIFIGITAAALDLIIGVIWGGVSGYFGGLVDDIMMRIADILMGIPYLLVVILLLVVMEPGLGTIIVAMSITGWVGMARLVRGQILQLKEMEYVLAAKSVGASPRKIILRHLIPNTMGVVLVSLTMSIPNAIFGEAFLSFIGLGVPMPLASLGTLANEGYQVLLVYPHNMIIPAVAISLLILSFNFVGDGLRDALDPRLRQ
ncbi:MAG TPA: ABC transporter permease [Firmicutes bacterium]|nr:ABC transporter permease [Candidatus Fermentithermobacillaceae bacterium]